MGVRVATTVECPDLVYMGSGRGVIRDRATQTEGPVEDHGHSFDGGETVSVNAGDDPTSSSGLDRLVDKQIEVIASRRNNIVRDYCFGLARGRLNCLALQMSDTPESKPLRPETPPDPASVEAQLPPEAIVPIPAPFKRSSYLSRHWKGELSLAQSFWVNTVLVNLCVSIISKMGASAPITNLIGVATFIVLYWSVALCLQTWQSVGVWRSASKSEIPTMGNIAKGVIVLFALQSVFGLYRGVFPQVREAYRMVAGDSQIEDFKVTVLPSGKAVEFYGGLKLGASKRLKEVLDSAPYITLIHLETLGGRYAEALEMAKIVKDRKLSTYVPNICASAGVVVFLAGKERTAKNNAKIGFHSGTFAGKTWAEANKFIEKIFIDAGVSKDFIARVTKSVEMVYPSIAELYLENIVTRITKGDGFSLGTYDLAKNTLENFRKSFLDEEMFLALSNARPKEFETLIQLGHKDLQQGESYANIGKRFQPLLMETVAPRWATASDSVMLLWLDYTMTFIRDNMNDCPAEVIKKLNNQPDVDMGKFKKWPVKKEQHIYATILAERPVSFPPERKERAKVAFDKISAETATPGEVQLLIKTPAPTSDEDLKKICEYMLRVYEAVNKLPAEQKADVCRFLLFSE